MRSQALLPAALFCLWLSCTVVEASYHARITVEAPSTHQKLDPMIYGQFLEHIYGSVTGGVYAEMLEQRGFEGESSGHLPQGMRSLSGNWSTGEGVIYQRALGANRKLFFDSPSFTDCIIDLEAKKLEGAEGFLLAFRVKDENNFYWWNVGGWRNTGTQVQRGTTGGGDDLGTRQPSSIDPGRWYRLKVRLEGEKIECFVDDKKLIDIKDSVHSSGRVGLATWETKSAFRNIKVYDLKGKLLWEPDLPQGPEESVCIPWKAFGDTACYLEDAYPKSFEKVQRLLVRSSEPAGLEQGSLTVKKGKAYRLSVSLKGDAAESTCEAAIVTPKASASYVSLGKVAGNWKEYNCRLVAPETCEDARLVIKFKGAGAYWIDQASLMSADIPQEKPFRADLLERIRKLHPSAILWPGGTYSEHYRWRDGVGPRLERPSVPNAAWGGIEDCAFGTDEYIALCRETGAEPVISLNTGVHDSPEKSAEYIRESLDWIEYCNGPAESPMGSLRAKNGHPQPFGVRYWVVGSMRQGMSAQDYCRRTIPVLQAIREKHPDLVIVVTGSVDYNQDWNRTVVEKLGDRADLIGLCHYNSQPGPWEHWSSFVDAAQYETYLRELGEIIRKSPNPRLRIAITGYNHVAVNMRGGMYVASMQNAFERCSDIVALSAPALLLRRQWSPDWSDALINHDKNSSFVSPGYLAAMMYSQNRGEYTLPVKTASPLEVAGDGRSIPILDASASMIEKDKVLILKVVNRDPIKPVSADITVPSAYKTKGKYSYQFISALSPFSENTGPNPEAVRVREGKAETSGGRWTHVFPACSVTVIRVPLEK